MSSSRTPKRYGPGKHWSFFHPFQPSQFSSISRFLHGAAERTHREEFYQVTPCSLEMKKLNRELRHWETIYNTVRPQQALGYLNSAAIPAPELIPTQGMKSVTHLLDE